MDSLVYYQSMMSLMEWQTYEILFHKMLSIYWTNLIRHMQQVTSKIVCSKKSLMSSTCVNQISQFLISSYYNIDEKIKNFIQRKKCI